MTVALPTPSQTVGPFFSMGLGPMVRNRLATDEEAGARIRISGVVLDGGRHPIGDAVVEVWQSDGAGRYRHPNDGGIGAGAFVGFGRAFTDFDSGEYWFDTVKPGPVVDLEGELQAPHMVMIVQARGMLRPVFTRVYFSDEAEANARDYVLSQVPAARRSTLLARHVDGSVPPTYRFDVLFQGEDETVFMAF